MWWADNVSASKPSTSPAEIPRRSGDPFWSRAFAQEAGAGRQEILRLTQFEPEEITMDAVIVSTARTPIGKASAAFQRHPWRRLGAHVIKHAAERAKVDLAEVEDVILGCAHPRHDRSNVPRLGDACRRARQRLGRHGEPLLLVGPADHLDGGQRVLVDKVPVMIAAASNRCRCPGPSGGNKNRLVNPWCRSMCPASITP